MRDEVRALFRHSRVYALGSVLDRGASFLLVFVYTRFLAPSEYGVLALVNVTADVLGTLLGLGLGIAMSRVYFDFTEERDRAEVVTTALLGFGAISALALLPLVLAAEPLAASVLGAPELAPVMLLGLVGMLLNGFFLLAQQYLRIQQRSGAFLAASTLRAVLYLALNSFFVIGLERGVRGAVLGILISNALATAVLVGPILFAHGLRVSPAKLREMLRFGIPLLPGSIAEFLFHFVDRFMISRFVSLSAVGLFFFGDRLGMLVTSLVIGPFAQIYVVRRLDAHGAGSSDTDAAPVFTYFFVVLVTCALGLALLAPELVAVVGSPAYADAGGVVPFLVLMHVTIAATMIPQLPIYYAKLSHYLAIASVSALLARIALGVALIPAFGIVGAAAAAWLSLSVRLGVTVYLGRRLEGPSPEWGRLALTAIAGLLAFAVGRTLADPNTLAGIASKLAVVAAFAALLLFSPVFRMSERRALGGLLRSGRRQDGPGVSKDPGSGAGPHD